MQNSDEMDFEEFKRHYQEVPVEEYPNNVLGAVPEPMVSVHVSTYQHADFIRDCLDGVVMQETDFPVEIIVGEDDSDDRTREICKGYADEHPDKIRLFLHRRENNIKIHGRPTGRFQFTYSQFVARGRYIATCEGDDYWTDPMKLQKQVEFLETNKNYSYCYHPFHRVFDGENNKRTKTKNESWAATSTLLFRNIIKKLPSIYFNIIHADTFLKRRLELDGKCYRICEIEPSIYRIHDGGIYGGHKNIRKKFEVIRSNAIMLRYFENTKVEKKIEKHIIDFLIKMLNLSSIYNFNYVLNSLRVLNKVGIKKRIIYPTIKTEIGKFLPHSLVNYIRTLRSHE